MGDLTDGTKTHANLLEAFAGECQGHRRYLWFAARAEAEGRAETAALLRSLAEHEGDHAEGHLDRLAGIGDPVTGAPIGDTAANLASALASKGYESSQMYPGFAKTARHEGFEEIAQWFDALAGAAGSAADRLRKDLDS